MKKKSTKRDSMAKRGKKTPHKSDLETALGRLGGNPGKSVHSLKRQKNTKNPTQPSQASLSRLGAIPLLFDAPPKGARVSGSVNYDSWAGGPPMGLRDITDGHIRRVRFQAGRITLELVAERHRRQWEFIARAYSGEDARYDFVFKVGRRKLLPDSDGFFHWSSESVPRHLGLLSVEKEITFEGLSW